jgi:hypothetical protein
MFLVIKPVRGNISSLEISEATAQENFHIDAVPVSNKKEKTCSVIVSARNPHFPQVTTNIAACRRC